MTKTVRLKLLLLHIIIFFSNSLSPSFSRNAWMRINFALIEVAERIHTFSPSASSEEESETPPTNPRFLPGSPLLAGGDDVVQFGLRFLPRGGCLALPIYIQNQRYFAIIDTGSRFLTIPPTLAKFTRDMTRRYLATEEQYGEANGRMQWRLAESIGLENSDALMRFRKVVLGVPPQNVVEDTGGIFVGLMHDDDSHPSFLSQVGYSSFQIEYDLATLTLSKQSILRTLDPMTMQMTDLSPFGPNLHHYGVPCSSISFETSSGRRVVFNSSDLKRSIVVVVDTGLSGCILSDSWLEEDLPPLNGIVSANVCLPSGQTLSSRPEYWVPTCFRLPWFRDERNHPHIVAIGATFLVGHRITIDSNERLLRIERTISSEELLS